MPEVKPNFSRDWVEFVDPQDSTEIYKCDLTWLTSYWQCIYGAGCQGIDEGMADAGCCSDGAYFSEEEDETKTLAVAARLTPEMWQFYSEAQPKKPGGKLNITEIGYDKDRKTRKVDNGCIFLNRRDYATEGFTGQMGCVLHHLAQKENIHFVETKPEVCWQLPIRRSYEKREFGEQEIDITVIGEYERLAWGDGGADFHWYCTSNTEAHTGKEPVYISNKAELVALMGEEAYQILVTYCEARMEIIALANNQGAKKLLPLINVHPATLGANRI
jgi:hypothetical protein